MEDAELIQLEEEEIIVEVEPSQELAVSAGAQATLFRTDDPVEIIEKATQVSDALADVLRKKGLTTRIGAKDYVQVEGWTLCGTMLGVYPIVEWTRPIEGGWEARVEARTRDGATVGAAEAECLRDEKRWKTADDYAVRSMAQTRAISKALRAPLGFIVALAGYEATPMEEMVGVIDAPSQPAVERAFDPAVDLLPGAIHGGDAPRQLAGSLDMFDPTVDWQDFLSQITKQVWKKDSRKELEGEDMADFWRRLSNAVKSIENSVPPGSFPPVEADKIMAGFIFAFNDKPLAVVVNYKQVERPDLLDKAPLTPEQAAEVDEKLKSEEVEWPEEAK